MKKWLAALIALGVVIANVLVYRHAAAMTDYAVSGERTQRPSSLSPAEKLGVLLTGIQLPRAALDETPADRGMPFDTLTFDSQSGFTLEAWHLPSTEAGVTVLLFHGYGGNKSSLLDYAAAWRALNVSVVLVDFFGSGGSSGKHTTIGAREALDVDAAVQAVQTRWPGQKLILHGLSMGGAAVLKAVAEFNTHADALVLESTYDTLLHSAQNRFRSMGLPGTPFAQWLLFWGGVRHGFDPFDLNPVEYARTVRLPVLLTHGAADQRVTVEQAESIADALPIQPVYSLYPGAAHLGMLASDRTRWLRDIEQLLHAVK